MEKRDYEECEIDSTTGACIPSKTAIKCTQTTSSNL